MSTRPVVLIRASDLAVVASFPLEPGQERGMNRCLVWHRSVSAEQRANAQRRALTERELVELLGPADEDTFHLRALPAEDER